MLDSFVLILVISGVTIFLRFVPFILFSKNTPTTIVYLGQVLPYSIMAMLVVYCLRNIDFNANDHGLSQFLAVLFVVIIHKWKHNTLYSILFGTLFYMVLVQVYF